MKIAIFALFFLCFFIYPAFGEQFTVTIPEGVGTPGCDDTRSCFVPFELSIDEGDTVTWSNDDSVTHTVTRTGSGSFNSDLLMAGDEFSFTFDQLGQFPYHCMLYPWMWGIIIVGDVVDTTDNVDDSDVQSTQKDDFSISLDRQFYFTGDLLTVLSDKGTTFEILDPDFNPILISQGAPPYTVMIGGSLWEKSGEYTAIVRDGSDTAQTTFFVNVEKIELADKERISIQNQKIANAFGDLISDVSSGQQVQITADILNNQNFEQEFAYVITTQDSDIISEPIWITGILAAFQELNPSLSWTPEYSGVHTITIQVWNNPLDKLQISQDVILEINVEGEKRPIIINETGENSQQDSTSELSTDTTEIFDDSPISMINDIFFVDDSGNEIDTVSIDQTVDITTTISNDSEYEQKFVFIVQIKDSNGLVVSIDYIQDTLTKGTSLNPSLSWKSEYPGIFTYEIFVWDNLDDLNALDEMSSSKLTVE